MRFRPWMIGLVGTVFVGVGRGAPVSAAEVAVTGGLPAEVQRVLEANCFKCHGPDKQKSGLRLDTLPPDFHQDEAIADMWWEAMDLIEHKEMPPDDEPLLEDEQRQLVVDWIKSNFDRAAADNSLPPPRVVMRRLNKSEYNHTMNDLLGVRSEYGTDLPSDPVAQSGFTNDGATLGMSALQMELYLDSAREALRHVLVDGPPPIRHQHETVEVTRAAVIDLKYGQPTTVLGRFGGFARVVQNPPEQREYLVQVTARAVRQPDRAWPVLKVVYGYTSAGAIPIHETVGEVEVDTDVSRVYTFRGDAARFPQAKNQGPKWVQVVALNNSLEDGRAPRLTPKDNPDDASRFPPVDPNFPKIVVEKLAFISGAEPMWPPLPHRRILFAADDEDTPAYREEVLRRFLRRAWRRPPLADEVTRYVNHYQALQQQPMSAFDALRETLAVALVSPHFLYLVEPDDGEAGMVRLDDFELASRLSYFLWSSMPDDPLSHLAEAGALQDPTILGDEVDRMLADPKSQRFVEYFTTEWLDLAGLERVAINPEYYPDFEDSLKRDMIGEPRAFFAEILRSGESARQLIDADWTMLNASLARHYGMDGPESQKFERVSLTELGRPGGLLGHSSMHLVTSNGDDSDPIKRAVWIRERLLDDPPRPPPADVPALPINDPDFARLSLREQLEIHRRKPSCASCHEALDPWGLALDHFDAVGHWRDTIRRPSGVTEEADSAWLHLPVDASTTMPDGTELNGLESLKSYLLSTREKQFARTLTVKLLSYALGRKVGRRDRTTVQTLVDTFVAHDYNLSVLIREIVASDCFQTQ